MASDHGRSDPQASPSGAPPGRSGTSATTERFDEVVQVVRPNLRVGLVVAVATIVLSLVWATTASITTSLTLAGAIMPSTGYSPLVAPATGIITAWSTEQGSDVVLSQVVGELTASNGEVLAVMANATGSVAVNLAEQGSAVKGGQTLAAVEPSGAARAFLSFPPPADGAQIRPGQSVVVRMAGCPAAQTQVSSVLQAPMSADEVTSRLGLPGVVPEIMPSDAGIGVIVSLPTDWCPDAQPAALGQAVVTTGSIHPIDYLIP